MRPAKPLGNGRRVPEIGQVMPMHTHLRRKLRRNRDVVVALVIIVGGGLSLLAFGLVQIS